jgi:Response regulators consisting of a CheY-like receiver domain and a winged-helix DNA-binding domain
MRVLVVEDEAKIASFIARAFEEEAYEPVVAADGESALALASGESFDLVVLDVMLPGIDGFEVVRRIRGRKLRVPVLMLTARDSVSDKVRGLDSGADDYLAKPFSVEELLARARALMRRSAGVEDKLRLADLELDRASLKVSRSGRQIDLTKREFALLEYLMQCPGRIATRSMIAEHVWGIDFDSGTNTIDVYIKYLRDKVDSGFDKKLIKTVRGRGYSIEDSPGETTAEGA